MSDLLLDSLLIENFRTFNKLHIPELGRVNLIVGRNGVGKTCLLEALWLYACRGNPVVIGEILSSRNEYKPSSFEEALITASYMFYGREEIKQPSNKIKIGSLHNPNNILSISIDYYTIDGNRVRKEIISPEEILKSENQEPRFSVEFNKLPRQTYPINRRVLQPRFEDSPKSIFVSTSGIGEKQLASLWDIIALTEFENDVSVALQVIDQKIERISMVGDKDFRQRYPIVKIKGVKRPIPLRSLGDGMTRVLGIALSAVNSSDGFLMIDEFENGLHYSIQVNLWRLIFKIAKSLNIQVFAISHSWDCIEAFQKADAEHDDQGGMLIRLERKGDETIPTLFNQRKLAIATREQIEVR